MMGIVEILGWFSICLVVIGNILSRSSSKLTNYVLSLGYALIATYSWSVQVFPVAFMGVALLCLSIQSIVNKK